MNIIKLLSLVLVCTCFVNKPASANQDIQQQVQEIDSIFKIVVYQDLEKAMELNKKMNVISKENNYSKGIAGSLSNFGTIEQSHGRFEKAMSYFKKARVIIDTHEFEDLKPDNDGNLAAIFSVLGQSDSSLYYFNRSIIGCAELKDLNCLATSYNNIATEFNRIGTPDSAITYFNKSISSFEEQGDSASAAAVMCNLSDIYSGVGNYEEAAELLFKALARVDEDLDIDFTSAIVGKIGIVLYHLERFHEAKEYFEKKLSLSKKLESQLDIGVALNFIGNVTLKLKNLDEAIYYFEESNKIFATLDEPDRSAMNQDALGTIYTKQRKFDQAIDHFTTALKIYEGINRPGNTANTKYNLGTCYLEMGNIKEASRYLNEGLLEAQSTIDKELIMHIHEQLFKLNKKQGRFKLALENYELFAQLRDSLKGIEKQTAIKEVEEKYFDLKLESELLQKKHSVDLLEKEKKYLRKKNIYYSILSGTLLILIIIVVLWMLSNNRLVKQKLKLSNLEVSSKLNEIGLLSEQIQSKNEAIQQLKEEITKNGSGNLIPEEYTRFTKIIDTSLETENDWGKFLSAFNGVYHEFFPMLTKKFPSLTGNDLKLCALIKLNFSSNEIATTIGISLEGVKKARQRLRKRLEINSEEDLYLFLTNLS